MYQIDVKHNRNSLSEGRSRGISIGFVRHVKDDKFETVMPISPCKDYLNDLVFVETRKQDLSKIYGYKHELLNFFNDDMNFMAATVVSNSGAVSLDNYKNIEIFLNKFEDYYNIEVKTGIFETKDDGMLLVQLSNEWCKQPYLISLYGLLFRIATSYDGSEDVLKYINETNRYDNNDYIKMKQIVNKLKKLKEIGFVEQKYINVTGHVVHNCGILGIVL